MNDMEPKVNVGILWRKEISFVLNGAFSFRGETVTGAKQVFYQRGKLYLDEMPCEELLFEPQGDDSSFVLEGVTIGVNFHWERAENQVFKGSLKLITGEDNLIAVNIIDVEEYLISVISSEMSAKASLELLKAHAVISRSWLLAQIEKNKIAQAKDHVSQSFIETDEEIIRWYDKEDHSLFDVCADDHCQRYQGITRASSNIEMVKRAVSETRGQVLYSEGRICDARFSKCCGGVFEEFQNCWEDTPVPYLVKRRDSESPLDIPNLANEEEAGKWIRTSPHAFCNTTDKSILEQVLNNYDQETVDFYRWKVSYSRQELSELVKKRSGIDFGLIQELIPVQRGTSGRLVKLKIVGDKKTLIIGKELEIRRILSSSHLYSSAFTVDVEGDTFVLTGAGWGHGVGLCQIGAAVMGAKGYGWRNILSHYYIGAEIKELY
jgi:SpoIID/LytB domain protein